MLYLVDNEIGCDGAHLLSQSLHTNTTLKVLNMSGNNIGDAGGCSLAKALSINKGLVLLYLDGNPLKETSVQQLIHSLQHNHTLKWMWLPSPWQNVAQNFAGYSQAKSRLYFCDWNT